MGGEEMRIETRFLGCFFFISAKIVVTNQLGQVKFRSSDQRHLFFCLSWLQW